MLPRTLTVTAAAILLTASACAAEHPTSGDGGHAEHGSGSSSHAADGGGGDGGGHSMAMPGMPEASAPPDSADWNVADADYLQMMVAHHSQAIDMAELVPDRASDPQVRRLAASIDAGQGREVITMATWLVDHGQPEPTVEGVAEMTSAGMAGMLTEDQLAELEAASGPEFDRLFLEAMIQHHQGAVRMAEQQLGEGQDVLVTEMATDVIAGQNAEIRRMRTILGEGA